jgi:hypothetical protein
MQDSNARLNSSISRKPIPLKNFGLTISSQATQQGFLFPSLLPHQKLRNKPLMCWHKPLGIRKQDIEYVGIACATDSISTSFPPVERHISIHPCTRFQTQSLRYLKAPLTELPTSDVMPKYFSFRDSFWTFSISFYVISRILSTTLGKMNRRFIQIYLLS